MKKPIYKKWWFWVVLILVIGAIGNMGDNSESTDQATPSASAEPIKPVVAEATIKPTEAPTAKPTEQPIPGTISMSPEEFKDSFNAKAKEIGTDLKINKLIVEDGAVQNTFSYKFTNTLMLSGTVNKQDGSIRDVLLIGTTDGTSKSVSDILIGMGVLILASNPELPTTEPSVIVKELGMLDEGADFLKINKSVIRNGIEYHFQASKEFGIMFSAGDANDK
ncbi:hypothetical protein [Paenibacillus sp. FSL L8-0708]|uniref:hypothetical protein n=1 Tax=Paenibacillus sp. FSL L8-0708 TaxID=2975311 RepID=UPI0030F548E0